MTKFTIDLAYFTDREQRDVPWPHDQTVPRFSLEKEQKVAGTGLGFCLRGHLVTRRSRVRLVPNNTVTNLRLKDH